MALSDAVRRQVRGAERPHGLAKAHRVSGTTKGVLSRSSIFSWRANRLETGAPQYEGTVGRFWSRGQT